MQRYHLFFILAWALISSVRIVAEERRATSPSSISARSGFQVQLLRSAQEAEGSWISLTFDSEGRLIVGIDEGGLGRLSIDSSGTRASFERLEETQHLRHPRGLLWEYDSLYVCATDSQAIYRLRDLNQDGQFEKSTLLKEVDYRSRFGHGTNQIVPAPLTPPWGGSTVVKGLYIVSGNDVSFPIGSDPRSPYRNPRNDWLLPSPHDAGHDDRVGHIIRTDADGSQWTIMAGGFRNQFDIAFNADGEMFTWDADMEWDDGLPWYRPTRLNHVVSGGEYGWRWGTGKWPAWFPDSLPTTLDTGLSSPTGLVFGNLSGWPDRYRRLLFMADWQNGRILMVDLIPHGASYTATSELFLEGGPLNVCDLQFGPDGNLYFVTGGRGSQSGLYRVQFVGSPDAAEHLAAETSTLAASSQRLAGQARAIRHRLEQLHVSQDAESLDFIWEYLGSEDVWLRFAARVALENLPTASWRNRVMTAADSRVRRTALLALSRVGQTSDQKAILGALDDVDWTSLSADELLLALRTMQLTFIRQGLPDEAARAQAISQIDGLYPHQNFPVNWLLAELLVYLDAPRAAERTLELLKTAPTQEEQIQYAKTLTRQAETSSESTKRQMLQWLVRSRALPGGKSVSTTLQTLCADWQQVLTLPQRELFADEINKLSETAIDGAAVAPAARPFVQHWRIDDLIDEVMTMNYDQRSLQAGQIALATASCLRCHRIGHSGAQIGPDLTNVGKRLDGRALLESILEPSKQVDPKYLYVSYLLDDGRLVSGRPTSISSDEFTIETDPLTGATVSIRRDQIEHSQSSQTSPMPTGLIDTLTRAEILDLIAALRRSAE